MKSAIILLVLVSLTVAVVSAEDAPEATTAAPATTADPVPTECREAVVTGPCKAYFTRYAFNGSTLTCDKFVYGGCQGTGNNFLTVEECNTKCVAPAAAAVAATLTTTTTTAAPEVSESATTAAPAVTSAATEAPTPAS